MSKRGSGSSTRARSEKTTLDEFLAKRGLSSPISDYMDDKMRIPHGLTRRQTEKMQREAHEAAAQYSARRESAIAEYKAGVASGTIREKSRVEVLMGKAKGIPTILPHRQHAVRWKNVVTTGKQEKSSRKSKVWRDEP